MIGRLPAVGLCILLAAGCGGTTAVPRSDAAPVPTTAPSGPTYAAVGLGFRAPARPRVVFAGKVLPLPRRVSSARWLSDGGVLVEDGRAMWVLHAGQRDRSAPVRLDSEPVVSPGRIAIVDGRRIRLYDDHLRPLPSVAAPTSAIDTDQDGPDAPVELTEPVVAGGVVWARWYVNSENDELTDHGVLRIAGHRVDALARNRPVVGFYPSSDGRALLVLVRRHGHGVSCVGCGADNRIEEWDVGTGEPTDLGRPPGWDDWRLLSLDKIGDRVVASFAIAKGEGTGSVQTWIRDDDGWSEVRTQRDRLIWWQGDRPLVQSLDVAKDEGDGAPYTLAYGADALLGPGRACAARRPVCLTITAPGSPIRPEDG